MGENSTDSTAVDINLFMLSKAINAKIKERIKHDKKLSF